MYLISKPYCLIVLTKAPKLKFFQSGLGFATTAFERSEQFARQSYLTGCPSLYIWISTPGLIWYKVSDLFQLTDGNSPSAEWVVL